MVGPPPGRGHRPGVPVRPHPVALSSVRARRSPAQSSAKPAGPAGHRRRAWHRERGGAPPVPGGRGPDRGGAVLPGPVAAGAPRTHPAGGGRGGQRLVVRTRPLRSCSVRGVGGVRPGDRGPGVAHRAPDARDRSARRLQRHCRIFRGASAVIRFLKAPTPAADTTVDEMPELAAPDSWWSSRSR